MENKNEKKALERMAVVLGKKEQGKGIFGLVLTGFSQVFFITVNTYMIAHEIYVGVAVCGFLISWIWSYNVKRVAFGSRWDRILYSTGATVGGLTGLWLATLLNL
jgi:hypothetical protein